MKQSTINMLDTLIVYGIICVCFFWDSKFQNAASFLRNNIPWGDISDNSNHQSQFAKKLCLFDSVTLKILNISRVKVRKFQFVEYQLDDLLQARDK